MFFNNSLKSQNQKLREELHALTQVKESLDEDMIRLSLDESGVVTSINDRFRAELNLHDNDVTGKHLTHLVPEVARNTEHFKRMSTAVSQGKHWNGALQIAKNNGQEAWLRAIVQPIRDINNQLISFSVFASELTRTIQTSREQEDMLNALHRSTAVIEFTLSGEILRANDNFLVTMGYTSQQIVGKHHRMFCEPAEANSIEYQDFWKRLARGQYVSERFKRVDSAGQVVWLEASYNPIHNDRGELYKVVKFATVITEQVNREQAVVQAANIAHGISQETGQQTEQGHRVINTTIQRMKELADEMNAVTASIEALNEHSQQISELVSSISDIADQTNLLALNAAIEAARAGEQGRGFAVVADEVRNLASRTNATTEEIGAVVSENVRKMSSAVTLIAQCQTKAGEALELSTEAGKTMEDIQSGAQQVVDAVNEFNQNLE